MNAIKLVAVAALIIPAGLALAQSGDMKGMDMMGKDKKGMDMKSMPAEKKAQSKVHKAAGVVKKMDPAKGTVTLAHGPVKDLNWSAMTMTFMIKDKTLLDKLAVDKKVEFEFVKQGSDYVVTSVK